MKHFSLYIIIGTLLWSCNSPKTKKNNPDAGKIEYIIKYPSSISNSPTSIFLPQSLILMFHENQIKYLFNGSLNIFSLHFLSPSPEDSCHISLHFMNKNLYYSTDSSNNFFLFNTQNITHITYDDEEIKNIAGFKCKKAYLHYKDAKPANIYYTEEIKLKKPNRHTPLKDIPGLLMQFPVEYNGIKFEFTAQKFESTIPTDSNFLKPKQIAQSSEKEIETIIMNILNSQ
jgi:GLPGLI family protein